MRRRMSWLRACLLGGSLLAVQCVREKPYLGAGASSGQSGRAGSGEAAEAGAVGVAGDVGAAGVGGVTAGSAGRGGRGGSGGAGGAGAPGGQAGECPAPERDPLDHCEVAPLGSRSECSFEDTCRGLSCGSPWSMHDEDGCLRRSCTSSDECDAGERCLPAPVAGRFDDCFGSGSDGCEYASGCDCSCSFLEDCVQRSVCVSEAEYPVGSAFECPVEGMDCDELSRAVEVVRGYILSPGGDGAAPVDNRTGDSAAYSGDALDALRACRNELLTAYETACGTTLECPEVEPAACDLQDRSECSLEETCAVLGCGEVWSFYDAGGCERRADEDGCVNSGDCADGERCVARPVAGYFGPALGGLDGCDREPDTDCSCGCSFQEGPPLLALCLPETEWPSSNDCPLEGLDCAALSGAREAVADHLAYAIIDEGPFHGLDEDTLASLEACAAQLESRIQQTCD